MEDFLSSGSPFEFPTDPEGLRKLAQAVESAMQRLGTVITFGNSDAILREWERMDPLAKAYCIIQAHKDLHETIDAAERVLRLFDSPRAGELKRLNRSLCEEFYRLLETLKPALEARIESGFAPWSYDERQEQPTTSAPEMEHTPSPLNEEEEQTVLRLLRSVGPSMDL